ncbi:MAG: NAD(P)/FAD-dependent oxidoreductase, partial [Clostridia bacterium]|nr:NAD(P)/FAD-dependent oxidoreductase [Clostridia bacterium]
NLTFTPLKNDDYNNAQVCAGGISSKYVYPDTLMSKTMKNLYICGEMLDVDGECGGYNLHFAFGSGIIVGKSIK